jgi:hypothetical protein
MIVIARGLLVPVVLAVLAALTGAAWAQGAFPPVSGGAQSSGSSAFPAVKGPSGPSSSTAAPSSGGSSQSSSFPAVNGSGSQFPSVNGTRASLPSGSLPPQTDQAPAGPGFGGGPPQGGGVSPAAAECMKQVGPMRDEVERRAKLVQEASKHHATAQEACKLIGEFSQAEQRFLTFVTAKQTACGIPAEIPKQMKVAHVRTEEMHKQVCGAANSPRAAAGPSLSDVIGAPSIPEDAPAKRKGGSTFDTINGNVLSH